MATARKDSTGSNVVSFSTFCYCLLLIGHQSLTVKASTTTSTNATTITITTTTATTAVMTVTTPITTPMPVPDIPAVVTVSPVNSSAINVSWTASNGSDSYEITCSSCPYNVTSNATQLTIGSLNGGYQYTVGVAACNDAGCSHYQNGTSYTIAPKPGNVSCTSSTNSSVSVTISPPAVDQTYNVSSYNVTYQPVSPVNTYAIAYNDNVTFANTTVPSVYINASSGYTYLVKVYSTVNGAPEATSAATEVNCTTVPLTPFSVTCGSLNTSSVQVSVSPPMESTTAFYIQNYLVSYQSNTPGFNSSSSNTVSFNNSTVVSSFSDALSGVSYLISVRSVVPGASSPPVSTDCTAIPTSPESLTCTTTNSSINLSIEPPSSSNNSYYIQNYTVQYVTVIAGNVSNFTSETSFDYNVAQDTFVNAYPGFTYLVMVYSVVQGAKSQPTSTNCTTVPIMPGGANCTGSTNFSVSVTIQQPSMSLMPYHIDNYVVSYSSVAVNRTSNLTQEIPFVDQAVTSSFENASSGIEYQVNIYSMVFGAQKSTLLSAPYVTYCTSVPPMPGNVSCGTTSNSSILVNIAPPSQPPSSYYVQNYNVLYQPVTAGFTTYSTSVPYDDSQVPSLYSNAPSGVAYSIGVASAVPTSVSSPQSVYCMSDPNAPANVMATTVNSSSLQVTIFWTWNAANSSCSNFSVSSTVSAVPVSPLIVKCPPPAGEQSVTTTLTGLIDDSKYNVSVVTVSSWSSLSKNSVPFVAYNVWTTPLPVKNLLVYALNNTAINISWTPFGIIDNIVGYAVNVSNTTSGNSTCELTLFMKCPSSATSLPSLPYSCPNTGNETLSSCSSPTYVINVFPGSNYTVSVAAANAGGLSLVQSATVYTQPQPNAPPPSNCDGGCVAGIVIGVIAAVIIALALFVWYRRQPACVKIAKHPPTQLESWPHQEESSVRLDDFIQYVQDCRRDEGLKFAQQFEQIEQKSPLYPCTDAEQPMNRTKNRFGNILPFDNARVKLFPTGAIDDGSDYINASYVSGHYGQREYIAAQAPMASTVDDFWRMIWEQNVTVVVMLANVIEKGQVAVEQYWPQALKSRQCFGDVEVVWLTETQRGDFIVRSLRATLTSASVPERIITHLHYTSWPDFGVPVNIGNFLQFVVEFSRATPANENPCLVHCRAGVGRTGTFILVDRLLQYIQYNQIVDVYETVLALRNCRRFMVQTEKQYIFAHDCVAEAIRRGWTTVSRGPQRKDDSKPQGGADADQIYMNIAFKEDEYANLPTGQGIARR